VPKALSFGASLLRCAASLVARAAIDYTAALFFVLRSAMKPRPAMKEAGVVDPPQTTRAPPLCARPSHARWKAWHTDLLVNVRKRN
jgi:predicted anti-sigma-YlaC factor YlaD